MEKKDLIIGVVGLAVCVIVAATVLMPILSDATKTTDTFKNEGYFIVEEFTGDNIEYSAKWDHTKPNQITVNDNDISLQNVGNTQVSLILDGNFFLRYFPATSAVSLYYGSQAIVSANVNDGTDMIVSYSDGNITFENTASTPATRVIPVETFYSISITGEYTMKKADKSAYMNSDSLVYGCGRSGSGDTIVGSLVYGTLDDVSVNIWRGDYTAEDITVNKTAVADHLDLYMFNSVSFTAVPTDEGSNQTITYSYVVVPAEVTAERSQHLDSGSIAIINAIPIIIIVAMITMAVGFFLIRRE